MAAVRGSDARAPAEHLDLEGVLFRAALLSGYGAAARPLARRLSAAARHGGGRSCLEAGTALQLTVEAPGPAALRVGLRLGPALPADETLAGLVPGGALARVREYLRALPAADHATLGTWLFWSEARQSVYVDLRDPSPAEAILRLRRALAPDQRERFGRLAELARHARPWVLRLDAGADGVRGVHLHWLLARDASPAAVAELVAPGTWRRALDVLGRLLRRPGSSGRWVIATPLDAVSAPALRIGNTGWSLVSEDAAKHRAVADVMAALDGPREYAEALWSACRGVAAPGWKVGRACELKIRGDSVRARLFFTPQVQEDTTAGTSTSAPVTS
jgi:hypothetical protein